MRSAVYRLLLILLAAAVSHMAAVDRAVADISLPALDDLTFATDPTSTLFVSTGAGAIASPAPESADESAEWLPPWARQQAPLPLFVQQFNTGSPETGMGTNTVNVPTGGTSQAKLAAGSTVPQPDLCLWRVFETEFSLPSPYTLRLFRPPRSV